MSHELEAEKSEVKVKNAETKKLTERINTMKNEQEMSEQARITAERKMVSFLYSRPFLLFNGVAIAICRTRAAGSEG